MFGKNDTTVTFGQDDVSTVDTYNEFDEDTKAKLDNTLFYSSLTDNDPNDIYNYVSNINSEVYGEGTSDKTAWGKNDKMIQGTKRTLREKLKNFTVVDLMAKMPFSPWLDYQKKAYNYAKRRIKQVRSARPRYEMTPMGGYTAIELPFQARELKQIIDDYEEQAERPQTIPATIFDGVTALPAYMIEFAVGGSAAESLGISLTGKGIIAASGIRTALQPSRVASSLIDQRIKGEEGATALLKAYGDVYIENLTEAAGENVVPLLKKMPFGGKLFTQMEKYAVKIGMPKSELISRISTKAGWNGILGEWGEERFATMLRAIFDVDDFGAGKNSNVADRMAAGLMSDMKLQNQLAELGVLAFPFGVKMISESAVSDTPIEIEKAQEAVQQPAKPTKAPERPTTPVEPTLPTTEPAKPQVTPEIEKVEPLTEEEITPEEQKVLEAEEAELVRPRLYIGNVTEGMKRRIADVMNWTKEQIKGFTEKGWPTKRTEVPLTRGEAEVALEDLTKDLKNRLDNNQINTENDLAFANAMWGNIAEIRKSLGMEKGQAPFRVIRAKGQPMKIIKNAKSRIWAAIQPGTLQESKMTVGEVLKAVVKGKAREAKMAWAAGRRELRSAIRMKKRAKARMEEALKSIKKKIPDSVDFYYREAIETLREGIDLKVKTEKAKESIQRTREFLERVPEHEEKMPTKLMERLYKKPLVDYTIEELEQIASEIDTLIEQGKLKRELTEKPKKKFREKVVRKMVDTIEKGKAIKSKTSEIASKGFLWSWRPQRIFDWLDNRANFDGLVHRTFYDSVKDAKAKAWNWVDKRVNPGTAKLKEFGLTQYDLARHRMTVEKSKIGKTERMTLDKMIGVYLFNKNLMSRLALLHGNEFTQEEIDDIISNLSENEKAWGDYMMDDFKKHWERYRSSVIEQENRDPGSAEFYFSMRRQERDYKTLDQEIIDELLHRTGLRKAYAEHGASLKRKHIPPEFQKPIKLDATGVWLEQVTAQEHYMNVGPIVRDLNGILNNNKFRKAVENRGGRALTKWLQNYVNAVANPNFYRSFNDIEKISRMIRQNAAIAYLGFNVVTMGKQLPSVFLYLPDAGISHLLQSAVEFAIDPMKTIREVRELDPFVKHKLMEREFAELEKTRTGTAGLIHQEVGMRSLEGIFFFDMIARTIGWKAVYNRGIADGLSQEEAIRKARNATQRTQPAAAAEDLPQLYRTSEFLNVFTQFTNQLNQLFNIATYDMPSMLLNKKYGDAALGGLGMSIVAATIWMIAHRKLPEEPEEVVEMFSEQAINMLPLFGKSIQAKRNGWESDVPVMQAISTLLGTPIKTLEDWDISEYEFKKILESIAVLTGTPYTQPERVYRAIKEEEPSLLIGGRKKKKKTSRRKIGRRG